MYQFLVDAWDALRLKFYPVAHYRYPLSITTLVLLTLGLINAASLPPYVIGPQAGIISFAVCLTVLRWLILCVVMKIFLSPLSRLWEWCGYILITEALLMPLVVLCYWPEMMYLPSFIWLVWIMIVQFTGLIRISKAKVGQIVLAYVVYFFGASMASGMLLFVFFNVGWLDLEASLQALKPFMDQVVSDFGMQ